MYLFEQKKQFDPDTGKEVKPEMVSSHIVCDYCGRVIPNDGDEDYDDMNEGSKDVAFEIIEQGGCEPMFDQLEIKCKEGRIDPYELFNTHSKFYYCRFWDGPGCEFKMLLDWAKSKKKQETLYDIMYDCRAKMLERVLKEKKFTFDDFQLELR